MITYLILTIICIHRNLINVTEYRSGNQKKDNPEKLTAQGTEDEAKQSKNITQYVLDTSIRKQRQIT
jgi:hypothetical protein